ncbi:MULTISPECIES: hypothetical protein [Clostridium]|uniref:hypothetical protein n=1 Tax=Clostridium TaxID=1485 RepID=UPI0018988A67|nr:MULTISPECIES: hypothetical protein [Clostridium]MCR1950988.1 hypothetical protein [Clostridium sp. DSM 100503]MDI9217612.1 hypothetical protein [Clostridium tertium]
MNNDIFVKLNYKTIGEFKSLIIDRQHIDNEKEKYLMCTGKYDKNGWTFIFKANSMKEAEDFINNNSLNTKKNVIKNVLDNNISFMENEKIHIPAWI